MIELENGRFLRQWVQIFLQVCLFVLFFVFMYVHVCSHRHFKQTFKHSSKYMLLCVHDIISSLVLDWLSFSHQHPLGVSKAISLALLLGFSLSFSVSLSPNYLLLTVSASSASKVFTSDFSSTLRPCHAERKSHIQGSHRAVDASVRLHHRHHED